MIWKQQTGVEIFFPLDAGKIFREFVPRESLGKLGETHLLSKKKKRKKPVAQRRYMVSSTLDPPINIAMADLK